MTLSKFQDNINLSFCRDLYMFKNPPQNMTLGYRIWQGRRLKGLSRKELANMLGIDDRFLSKIENDHVIPERKILTGLEETLDLVLD